MSYSRSSVIIYGMCVKHSTSERKPIVVNSLFALTSHVPWVSRTLVHLPVLPERVTKLFTFSAESSGNWIPLSRSVPSNAEGLPNRGKLQRALCPVQRRRIVGL